MVKSREGFHNATLQIPLIVWEAVCRDADAKGRSATEAAVRALARHYKIDAEELPKRKRAGRPKAK